MATNLDIIAGALRELNVIPEGTDPTAEQGAAVLKSLNDMLEAWTEDDIELGWFVQSSVADTFPLPAWTRLAVQSNLAMHSAPHFGVAVSPELSLKAGNAYRTLTRKAVNEALIGADMRHLPIGSGWSGISGRSYNIDTDEF